MKRLFLFLLVGVLAVSIAAAPVAQETTRLQPARDATLFESLKGDLASSTGENIFVGRTGQAENGKRRGLIAFDLSSIPVGSRIRSVTLTMTVTISANGAQLSPVQLKRVSQSWVEGTTASQGGRGAQAEMGDTTWIHRNSPTTLWTRPGGDYVRVVSAKQQIGGAGVYTWNSTRQLVADVQSWVNAPKKNFGWILIGDETKAATAKVFVSREGTDEAARPQLTVTFTAPTE